MPGIRELSRLHDKTGVFRDRTHAGQVTTEMLAQYRNTDAVVLGIPAGGIPVAAEIARRLDLALDVAVVSKILLPWTTEAGFGAVAWDGTVWVNEGLVAAFGLRPREVELQTEEARAKVYRRAQRYRGAKPFPRLDKRTAILVDDGLASGSTMRVAIEAVRSHAPSEIVIAIPTGHGASLADVLGEVDKLYCANIRTRVPFAVADAYQRWHDEDEENVEQLLKEFGSQRFGAS